MPEFISDDEFAVVLSTGDVSTAAEKAGAFIRTLYAEIETVKAKADAAAITAEQTCSILENKYVSLSSEFSGLESRYSEIDSSLQERSSELAKVQSEKHQLYLKFIEKDGEIERLKTDVSELQKSKRQLVEVVGAKDAEISEKDSTIKSYLDKMSDMATRFAQREARVSEAEAELLRWKAQYEKTLQEKEIFEQHNAWLNDELTAKVDSSLEQRRKSAECEADMSAKLANIQKEYNECSSSLNWYKERVRELELKLESTQRDLCSASNDASATEQRYSAEISTVSKLVDLYKESSEEWSKKAGELEGVIKALETHISQAESDYKDKLEKETATRKEAEMKTLDLSEKVSKLEAELESSRRASELDIVPLSSFRTEALSITAGADDHAIVPHVPAGVSGTALAASLLREGWSLAKMYARYQEAADALQHEQMGRKQTESILERVLFEIEAKASVLLDERAEHERMADAYELMNQKLQQSLSEQGNLEKVIRELKAEVKKYEREYNYAQKEIMDLQKQVTILLKECRDVQLRCGSVSQEYMNYDVASHLTEVDNESDAQKVISEHLLSVKDIKGLVEQNAKLRSLVRSLSDEVENREMQAKEIFAEELQKHKEEAASRVAAVLERAEEQGQMIESLHSSVSMFRRLYEEEHRLRSSQSQSQPQTAVAPSPDGKKDFMLILENSQEATKRVQEEASHRVRCLEDELARQKTEIISLRSERDKLALEANFAQEKLERFMKDFNHQKEESSGILVRNIEFSQIIVDYQKKLRESSESVNAAEDLSRKLNVELSVLRREKELLLNSEKRAHDEIQDLSQRVYRLQASLVTVQSSGQVQEQARAEERRKQEEYIKQIEREWAEAKNELQKERNNVRTLSLDQENTRKDAMRQVEEIGERLEAALKAVSAADGRAAAAEARCSDLERNLMLAEAKIDGQVGGLNISASTSEIIGDFSKANQEIERLKSEALASKDHMLQYKSIAQVNEAALKQMEGAHESFKIEAEQFKRCLESEIQSLRDKVVDLENEVSLKSKEVASAASQKDEALASALAEITALKEETSNKVAQFMAMELQVSRLKEDLGTAQQRGHAVQANYERQVILQSETIQELSKTSQALAVVQEEASALRRTVDAYKSENVELKAKWISEKSELEKSKNDAVKKYDELNDQNKVLHCQLEALHIKLAGKEHGVGDIAPEGTSGNAQTEAGLQSVVSYLRRSREIAETEISLLKQEKLRLQSQLERALKAAEAAESSLSAERLNSRSLFTEGEFNALKLQVSEINLLRESNMQLREENKHNFEECQKLREVAQDAKAEAEKLQNILNEKEVKLEGLMKEVEQHKKEKEQLERQISEMLEVSKNLNLEDYNVLKSEVGELQGCVREKEAVIEDTRKLISQKQELIEKLEQDLAMTRLQLTEKDSHVAQVESSKLDVDKQKKLNSLLKRRADSHLKEKEAWSKEKETLLNENEVLRKGNDALLREKDILLKEMDDLSKEKQLILKQLDDLLREKEATVEALSKENEELLKEKDDLSKGKQTISEQLQDLLREKKGTTDTSVDPAVREKEKEKDARLQLLESMHRKEKEKRQSIEKSILLKVETVNTERKKIEDELERQKETIKKTSEELEKLKHGKDGILEGISVNNLDDQASAYVLAVEELGREAHIILNKDGNQGSASNSSSADATPVSIGSIQASKVEIPVPPPAKAIEDREGKVSSVPKLRKLVRPRLVQSGEQIATQSSVAVSSEPSFRKRPASPSLSELHEQDPQPGDSSTDFLEPFLKKSKGLGLMQEDADAQTDTLENAETIPTVEELLDAVCDVPQGLAGEPFNFEKDVETVERIENDLETIDMDKGDGENEENISEASKVEPMVDEPSDLPAEQDGQNPMIDANEGEEGEMVPESSYVDDDPLLVDIKETTSEITNANEQKEEGELAEDVAENSEKSNNGDEQTAGVTIESSVSRGSSSSVASGQESQPSLQVSRTINLEERARERKAARLGQSSPASASPSTTSPAPAARRGRGRPLSRTRGRRGARQG